jgi:hypothetical protein
MPTRKGAYSSDFNESNLMADEFNWMPSNKPNVYVRDAQAKNPGKQRVIDAYIFAAKETDARKTV